jgi:hypothetical protein
MISHKSIAVWSLVFIFVVSFSACSQRSVPIINYDDVSFTSRSDKTLSLDDVNKALAIAAVAKQWKLSDTRPGHATATCIVRGKHTIVVDITYTEKTLSIKYKDSTNMLYDKDEDGNETIHTNYNRWVSDFLAEINKELLELK